MSSNFTVHLQQTSCDYGIENSSTRASRDGAAWLWGGELGGSVEVGSRASRPPSVADLFQSQAVLDARLTRPSAQQRTWGIATISAGKCRRFGHRNLKRITMERIMTVKAWTREDGILSHLVGHDARAPVSTLVSPHLTVRLSTLGDPSGPRRTAPSPQP